MLAARLRTFRDVVAPADIASAMLIEPGEGAVHVTVVQRAPTSDEFERYLGYMTGVIRCREPIAIVIDASLDGPALGITQLRKIVDWMRVHRPLLRQHCLGYALIRRQVPTPVRFATSMMLSLLPVTPMPYRMFGDRAAAMTWINALIAGKASQQDLRSRAWSEPPAP